MAKRALIIGVSGQDGSYLAQHLLTLGYEVVGLSRDAETHSFTNLVRLGIKDRLVLDSISPTDFRSVVQVFGRYEPDEVYNLSGQSSVGLSFSQPVETIDSHLQATIIILEVIKFLNKPIRFYNACSSECFGETDPNHPASELTPFRPRSPYALGKSASFWAVDNYREAYGLFACSGILGNHESPLRSSRFVTQKVIAAAGNIRDGSQDKLYLGNTAIVRDWGWAPEYVVAMHGMLNLDFATDFVIATGHSCALSDFVDLVFRAHDLDSQDHVEIKTDFLRPTDIKSCYLNPQKAKAQLNWEAQKNVTDVVEALVDAYHQQPNEHDAKGTKQNQRPC